MSTLRIGARRASIPATALVLSFALMGCSRKDTSSSTATTSASQEPAPKSAEAPPAAAKSVYSCRMKDASMCSEWSGLSRGEVSEAKASCVPDGVFGSTPCSTDKLVGTCDHKDENVKMFVYKSALISSVNDAKELCDDGVFTAAAH